MEKEGENELAKRQIGRENEIPPSPSKRPTQTRTTGPRTRRGKNPEVKEIREPERKESRRAEAPH